MNNYRKKNQKMFAAIASIAGVLGVGSVESAVLEEVMVTAQKREQNLQDVGISVTAFSGDQLRELGFRNTTEIVGQTPSLQLYEFSPTLTVYNLRGVSQNSFGDSLEAPVAVYVDNVYVASMGALNATASCKQSSITPRHPAATLNRPLPNVAIAIRKPLPSLPSMFSMGMA